MQIKTLSATLAGLLLAAGSMAISAQTITIGQASVPSASGGSAAISVSFDDNGNANVGAYNTEFDYSTLTAPTNYLGGIPTSNSPLCVVTDATKTVSVSRFSATPGVGLPDETLCTITFAVNAGTPAAAYALAHDASPGTTAFFHTDGSDITGSGTVTDGAINVVNAGPPTITIDTTPLTLPTVTFGTTTSGNIAVTAVAGGGSNPADTASFSCTAPAGFTVAPLSGGPYDNGQVGTVPANLAVSCTTGAAVVNGTVACTATNTTPSSVNFDVPVTCPAGTMSAPVLTPTPANGSTVTLGNGAPGATTCTSISIAPSGGAGATPAEATCTGVGVTVTPSTLLSFPVGSAAQTVSVCGTLTDTANATLGTVTCTGTDGSAGGVVDWAFTVAAPAGVLAPANVPATSLWSKLALFGLFGALGMLVLGLRRSH
ncbi:MAG TPA: hypothetical protein VFN29_01340 [Chiayiivirga sp.]|nr:hypothetical protein [Chiayiivirga sp.]